MYYVNKLLKQQDFLRQLKELEQAEKSRPFCRHGLSHLLDVARIAWISNLEGSYGMEKEQLYLAALLHDIGRAPSRVVVFDHEISGAQAAERFLDEIGYPKEKAAAIYEAIKDHRDKVVLLTDGRPKTLASLLSWADKKSRNCFWCQAVNECKWPLEKRNNTII